MPKSKHDEGESMTATANAAMWKGSSEAAGEPHICPFNPNGMSMPQCVETSGANIERNRGGCCGTQRGSVAFAPCNSKSRRCIVCLEQGRRRLKANAVTNIENGTCEEHDVVIEKKTERRLPSIVARPTPAPKLFADFRREQHERLRREQAAPKACAVNQPPVSEVKAPTQVPPHKDVPAPVARLSTHVDQSKVKTESAAAPVPANKVLHGEVLPPEKDEPRWKSVIARVRKAIAGAELIKLPPERFRPQPGQPREYFDEGEMDALEESIREVGQIQDGMCRLQPNGSLADHELLDGERRWRCVSHARIPEYRAKRVEIDDEAAPYMIAAISNFNRSDHTVLEKSNAIEKLHNGDLQVPMVEIAKMLGLNSLNTAYKLHSLQKLCPEVKNMLDPRMRKKEDLLPIVAGYQLARLGKPELYEWQKELATKLLKRQITIIHLGVAIDKILGAAGGNVGQRHQPARRWAFVERRLTNLSGSLRELKQRMETLDAEGTQPPKAKELYASGLNDIIDEASKCLKLLGIERRE